MARLTYPHSINRQVITVAAADAPAFWKLSADYLCDGVADDVQLQAAIDEARSNLEHAYFLYAIPQVVLSPGTFHLAANVQWKSCGLRGAGTGNGTALYWDGANGATAITRTTDAGSVSWRGLHGVEFQPGAGTPGTWLDLTAAAIDAGFRLSEVHFVGGSGPQVTFAGFTNAHWEHVRFDGWGTYAMECVVPAGANLGTFRLSGITADNNPSTTSKGFIHIDNTTANAANIGTFHLIDGRYEINKTYAAGSPAGFIVLSAAASNPQSQVLKVHLEDIVYQDVVGNSNDVLLYSDTTATSVSPSLILENFHQDSLSALFGGTWFVYRAAPPLQNGYGYLAIGVGSGPSVVADQVALRTAQNGQPLAMGRVNETGSRLTMSEMGVLAWGDGTSATDTTLQRAAANVLQTGGAFGTLAAVTGSRVAAATAGAGAMMYDTTLHKPIWSDGTSWRDATGTVV